MKQTTPREMRDLLLETIVSERTAINILANYFGIDRARFNYVAGIDPQSPYDFSLGDLKFDVKFSNPTYCSRPTSKVWDFDLRGKPKDCHFYVLIGMIEQRPKSAFLVPAKGAPTHHIRISPYSRSKWSAFKIWNI